MNNNPIRKNKSDVLKYSIFIDVNYRTGATDGVLKLNFLVMDFYYRTIVRFSITGSCNSYFFLKNEVQFFALFLGLIHSS